MISIKKIIDDLNKIDTTNKQEILCNKINYRLNKSLITYYKDLEYKYNSLSNKLDTADKAVEYIIKKL